MAENEVTEIEFNSMVAVLKRLDKITYEINEARKYGRITEMCGLLSEYYKEISIDLGKEEKKIITEINAIVGYVPNVRKSKKWILLKLDDIDVRLRGLAKAKGYLTKQSLSSKKAIVRMS